MNMWLCVVLEIHNICLIRSNLDRIFGASRQCSGQDLARVLLGYQKPKKPNLVDDIVMKDDASMTNH